MSNISPFPSRPSPRETAFDREIEALVAPGLAEDLGVGERFARPRSGTRPPDHVPLAGFEAAVLGDMKSMSLEGRKALWKAGQRILDAEHHGHAVVGIHVVTTTAINEARA